MKLNINPKMAFIVLGVQVIEYQVSCGSSLPVCFLLKSLSESILYLKPPHVVELLIAALKNIYVYVFMETFFLNICMICLLFIC